MFTELLSSRLKINKGVRLSLSKPELSKHNFRIGAAFDKLRLTINKIFGATLGLTIFLSTCVFLQACKHENVELLRKEMPFDKYGFVRDSISNDSFEFLMGNGEMGGRVHLNGLGLEKIWFADYWKNPEQRQFLPGLLLTSVAFNEKPIRYKSELDIDKALCTTQIAYANGAAYESQLFFSFEDVHSLGLTVRNQSEHPLQLNVTLPVENFTVSNENGLQWSGTNQSKSDYNQISWALQSNIAIVQVKNTLYVSIPAQGQLQLSYSVITQHDSENHQEEAIKIAKRHVDVDKSFKRHYANWKNIRNGIGSIILPPSDYAKWFYRSIYTNYATAGSKKFLAAETQFAYPEEDWDMHAFTYGHGTWAALSFLQMGDSLRAKQSLQWLYQPESLQRNVRILVPDTGDLKLTYRSLPVEGSTYFHSYPQGAMAFGHEQTDFGLDIPYEGDAHWDLQFHLNGFATSIFHRYALYYRDSDFEENVVYPVAKGTGLFWKGLLKKDKQVDGYFLPPMLSLSENIVKPSVLDAALAAKWNLSIADLYEKKFGASSSNLFAGLSDSLYLPQNDSIYLEYLNDPQQREGGGYFGIRACAYLGFPLYEQIASIDKVKARATLDKAWQRNSNGKGMISFIANWFALTETCFGNGDLALEKSSRTLLYQDKSDVLLYEAFAYRGDSVRARFNPYFLTGYSSFSLVPIAMMVQSYNQSLYFFPAVPSTWNNVEFYDMPVEGGYRVSGVYRSKTDFEVTIKRNGKLVKHLKNVASIRTTEL